MKKIYALVVFVFFFNLLKAQITFQKTYGISSARGYYVQQTADSGYIITGDYCKLIKIDYNGDTLWTKFFSSGAASSYKARSIQQTTDGGYIITGNHLNALGDLVIFLIKTDFNGDTLWTKAFEGGDGYSVQQTSDGGFIITGWTASFGTGNDGDVLLIKTDINGDTLWTKRYGGSNDEYGLCVRQTTDGGYIIEGTTPSFGAGSDDIYLIKTNSSGDTLWTKTFGGVNQDGRPSYDNGSSIQQTSDSGYIIVSTTQSFGAGGGDVYLIKTDFNGDTLWTKTFGGTSYDVGNSVQQTSDGGYIITGFTSSFGIAWRNIYLIKTDANGNLLWSKTYGGGYFDEGYSAQQTTDGGYIVSGYTGSFGGGGFRTYLIKTDANGNSGCNQGNPATISGATATQVSGTSSIVTVQVLTVTTPPMVISVWASLITLCSTVDINEITDKNSFEIFPNPGSELVIINAEFAAGDKLRLTDTIRRTLFTKTFSAPTVNYQLSTVNLQDGIYFLEINFGEERVVRKIVKQ